MTTNVAYKQWLAESDESIIFLDKAEGGKVAIEDVQEGLKEYKRLFRAGLASPAEILTLHRAYPDVSKYANVVEILDLSDESEPTVIGGPASVELVDREGHLITSEALEDAFKQYMDNFRTRNVMVMHSDVQVGHALPVYISKGGQIFKSGVEGTNLFFISELRDDTKISQKVKEQINSGKMRSYSIAGSATKTQNISKGADSYMQVDSLELAEITICEKGVNQGAHFELMKAEQVIPTEPEDNLFVISKEDIPSFTEVFSTWFGKASKEGIVPELNGKQMAVLENGTARQIQHRALLDELGFPMYVYPENLRHPVDYDEPGRPVPSKIVNQAGQDLGDANIEEMVKSATGTFINILSKQDKTEKGVIVGDQPNYADDEGKVVGHLRDWSGRRVDRVTPEPVAKMNEATPAHEPNINPVDMNDYTGDEEKDKATEKGIAGALAGLAAGAGKVAGGIAEGVGHLGAGAARGVGHTAGGVKDAVFGEEEEKMVKSATDTFTSILRKQGGDETRTTTTTRYSGELPRAAVDSSQRTQQASGGQLLPERADKVNITTKEYEYPSRGTKYQGKVETTTVTDAPKGASTSQGTTATPTEKVLGAVAGAARVAGGAAKAVGRGAKKASDYVPLPASEVDRKKKVEKLTKEEIITKLEKVGQYADDQGKVIGHERDWRGRRTDRVVPEPLGGPTPAPSDPAYTKKYGAGATITPDTSADQSSSSLTMPDLSNSSSTEKGFLTETSRKTNSSPNPYAYTGPLGDKGVEKVADGFADVGRSAKRPSHFNVGEHSLIQTSVDEDEEESLKKSTDIFKRVLEAERPDETWTGTDKEKDVPMEKIIGALLAPVAGVVGAGLAAVPGIAGGAAKKLITGG